MKSQIFTSYVARQTITDLMLDEAVVIEDGDSLGGPVEPTLRAGDRVSYRDLLYGAMLPSHNPMTRVLARQVGDLLGGTGGIGRFRDEMYAIAERLGWQGVVFGDPSGLGTDSRMTPRQLVELMFAVAEEDPLLLRVMGELSRTITIRGANTGREERIGDN